MLTVTLLTVTAILFTPTTEIPAADNFIVVEVKKADVTNAKKVHDALMTGKEVRIEYAKAQMTKLQNRVASNYSYGIKFEYRQKTLRDANGKWTSYFVVSAENAAAYAAAVNEAVSIIQSFGIDSTASDELAQEIHDTLYAKQACTFYVTKKSVIKDLIAKVEKVNNQGVIFKYTAENLSGLGCYRVTVSAKQAKEYYWMVKLSAKILEVAKQKTSDELILAADSMGDLSDIMKLVAVTCSGAFGSGGGGDATTPEVGIRYSHKNKTNTSDTVNLLKALYNCTARGVCEEFAKSEVFVFGYWGIDVNYKSNSNHAWTEGTAANADGEMISYKFDYGFASRSSDTIY